METFEQRAVARCEDEIARASCYLRAYRGLMESDSYHGLDFIRLSAWAFRDQMVGHACKVFLYREKAGLWYLIKKNEKLTTKLCEEHGIMLECIHEIENKLAIIRDKTLFHLDKEGVKNSRIIWARADLTWDQLEKALDSGLRLLCLLHKEIRGSEYRLLFYDGSDARRIAEHAYQNGLLSTGAPENPDLAALFE